MLLKCWVHPLLHPQHRTEGQTGRVQRSTGAHQSVAHPRGRLDWLGSHRQRGEVSTVSGQGGKGASSTAARLNGGWSPLARRQHRERRMSTEEARRTRCAHGEGKRGSGG
jgi:hypothetical protein